VGEIYIAIGVAVIVAAFLLARAARGKPSVRRPVSTYTGPASVNFQCAGCGQQFQHTKRTIAAWKKGFRRISCDRCHKNWRDTNPTPPLVIEPVTPSLSRKSVQQDRRQRSARPEYVSNQPRSGCLGVVAFLIFIPAIFVVLAI
jgi:hypothetical protein